MTAPSEWPDPDGPWAWSADPAVPLVFVVTEEAPHEGGRVVGVYANQASAKAHVARLNDGFYYGEMTAWNIFTGKEHPSKER